MSLVHTREDESRRRVWMFLLMSLASYVEQEGKRGDQWRDQTLWQHFDRLKHELEEVRGNLGRGETGYLVHNLFDVVSLGAIMGAKALEDAGLTVQDLETVKALEQVMGVLNSLKPEESSRRRKRKEK